MMGTFDPDMFDECDMYGGFDKRRELGEMHRYLDAIDEEKQSEARYANRNTSEQLAWICGIPAPDNE